ncbi:MAG: hypothetical protein AAFO94_04475, partial [Bacteroidota bacterium]
GSSFVVKLIREKVDDPEQRQRIIAAINAATTSGTSTPVSKDKETMRKERHLRQGRHLYEDFNESASRLRHVGRNTMLIGLAFLISVLVLGAYSWPHAVVSILAGAVIMALWQNFEWENKNLIYMGIGAYLLVLLLEYLVIGLPDRLWPNLGEDAYGKWINIVTIFNDLTPLMYYFAKLVMVFPFLQMLYYLGQLKKLPKSVKNEIGLREI